MKTYVGVKVKLYTWTFYPLKRISGSCEQESRYALEPYCKSPFLPEIKPQAFSLQPFTSRFLNKQNYKMLYVKPLRTGQFISCLEHSSPWYYQVWSGPAHISQSLRGHSTPSRWHHSRYQSKETFSELLCIYPIVPAESSAKHCKIILSDNLYLTVCCKLNILTSP